MKKILYLVLFSSPILAMQQPERPSAYENRARMAVAAAYVWNTPVIRDAAIVTVLATATTVPVLIPAAVAIGIGMRIVITEQNNK